jgi:hypothetical protein
VGVRRRAPLDLVHEPALLVMVGALANNGVIDTLAT